MNIPASAHFTPVNLTEKFNAKRQQLAKSLQLQSDPDWSYGMQTLRGIPFALGTTGANNVFLLDQDEVAIPLDGIEASYLVIVHVVEDREQALPSDMAELRGEIPLAYGYTGNELGDVVSEYRLEYSDGSHINIPILRRFAIQQARIGWGASPFAAVSASEPGVESTATELHLTKRPSMPYGRGETRHASGRDRAGEHLWLYALPNPHPDKALQRLVCVPKNERSAIYALSHTRVDAHPLRPGTRQKLKLTLPETVELNEIAEFDGLDIDLGMVISVRAALDYERERWSGNEANVQPTRSERTVIVEYIAHPMAKLYVDTGDDEPLAYDLSEGEADAIVQINPATRPVKLRVVDKETGQPVAVRLHLHGAEGEYLPPKGFHRKVNPYWFEDNYGEFVNSLNQYCYIPGECEVDLPPGEVFIEITRGYEIAPIRSQFTVNAETEAVTFELEKVLHWREKGWVTADTHVHFLSPQTALLEGAAEGVNVVNLLASQWGEMFSNVSDFDGKTTFGAKDFGGDSEFLVRVGTENRMQVLGHISLLGYAGAMIQPLCSGGPSESAIGDALEVTMADWAQRCIDQNGLVVLPHAPNPQAERAADIVLGLVHAIEMMTFNPFNAQISPYGLADWYRFLNLGYHIPVVGGSDKMAASSLLGGIRTYAHLGENPLTYNNWMTAVQTGNTFVTVGPLAELLVDGITPGQQLNLSASGGTVDVTWRVESVQMPIDSVEIVVAGLATESISVNGEFAASGSTSIKVTESTWIALRVRGSYADRPGEIAAHTSAVQVLVDGKRIFSEPDALTVLEQIEGAMAYVDTLAPRPDAVRYKRIRATLESAHNRLHQMMHRQGIYHEHTPLHHHDEHHEH